MKLIAIGLTLLWGAPLGWAIPICEQKCTLPTEFLSALGVKQTGNLMHKKEGGKCTEICTRFPFAMRLTQYRCGPCPGTGGGGGGGGGGTTIGTTKTGLMTMWTADHPGPVQGSSCGYADTTATSKGSSWLSPYVNNKLYCAVNSALFDSGRGCGTCYTISYGGTGGTDPGRAGSAEIQVVDSGSAKEFDCQLFAFNKITGANTGVFPVSYTQVTCTKTGTTVVILDGNNAFYVKVLIAGGVTGVKSVKITVGSNSFTMNNVVGATWAASLSGATGAVKFDVTFTDGSTATLNNCFGGSWPVSTGSQCS